MDAVERRQQILELLCQRRKDTMQNLAAELGVSERTIRRDVEILTRSYPLETVCGRYGGGVRVADWYHLDRQRMSPRQTALLRRLAADLRGEDLEVMEQIELSTLFITHDIDEAILLSDRIYLLSGKPGHITAELNLHKESRPRGDFALTSQFLEYKKEILSLLQF